MNGIGAKGANGAPPGEGVENVHPELTEGTPDEASPDLHDIAGAAAEPGRRVRQGGLPVATLLVVLTLGLLTATVAGLAVAGLALAIWPALLMDALANGRLGEDWPVVAAMLAAPLVVFGLLDLSWRAFARGRTGRCADFMLAALAAALGLHAVLFGAPWI
jgi:hypothetical protein